MPVDLIPLMEQFEEFFSSVYSKQVGELAAAWPSRKSLAVEYSALERFNPQLADELLESPDIVIGAAEQALAQRQVPFIETKFEPHVRFYGLPPSSFVTVENVGAAHIGKLIAVDCMITKRTEIRPKVRIAVLTCRLCDAKYKVPMDKNTILPEICEGCKRRALVHDEEASFYVDLQKAEAQEPLEQLRGGAPATHVELWVEDDLVNTFFPGQRLIVTGVVRIRPPPPAKGKSVSKLIYSRYLEVLHIQKQEREFEEVDITPEERKKIIALSKEPDIYQKIVKSIAPSIYGHEEVKEALALQLFGGTPDKFTVDGGKIRNDIHILLIGDPGVSKCVTGDSLVVQADGSMRPIGEVVEGVLEKGSHNVEDGVFGESNHDLISLGLQGRAERSKATRFWKLEAPEYLYRIKTASGKEVTTTPAHPFFVSKDGMILGKEAQALRPGDFIASPARIPIEGAPQPFPMLAESRTNARHFLAPTTVTPEIGAIIGYLLGDGYVRRSTSYEIGLANTDEALLTYFEGCFQKAFGIKPRRRVSRGVTLSYIHSMELGHALERMGLLAGSWEKQIPLEIQRSPNEVVVAFLRAYFDCEATVSQNPAGITISASPLLLKQIQLLLLRFGIVAFIHTGKSRATNHRRPEFRTHRCLSIFGEAAARFATEIGFTSPSKQARLAELLGNRKFNTSIDVVPGLSGFLRSLRTALHLTQFECGIPRSIYQRFERGDRHLSKSELGILVRRFSQRLDELKTFSPGLSDLRDFRRKLHLSQAALASRVGVSKALVSQYEAGKLKGKARRRRKLEEALILWARESARKSEEDVARLSLLAGAEVFWDRVTCVEKVKPPDRWVYDLTVDGLHNFVSNGIFVHNTRMLQYVTRLAPKSIYVGGKSTSGVGLCVGGDSLVLLNDEGLRPIRELVETGFQPDREHQEGVFSGPVEERTVSFDMNLKARFSPCTRRWKIISPERLIRLTTRRGKSLVLTPATRVLTLENGSLVWKPSREIRSGQRIATSRSIPALPGKKIPVVSLLRNANIRLAGEVSALVREATGRLVEKHGNLTRVAELLAIPRNRLYKLRLPKYSRGAPLSLLRTMLGEACIPEERLVPYATRVFLRYGKEMRLPGYVDERLAYLAGLVAGGGHVWTRRTKSTTRFHSSDPELLGHCARLVRELFEIEPEFINDGKQVPCVRIHSAILAELLAALGVPPCEKSHLIDVPNAVASGALGVPPCEKSHRIDVPNAVVSAGDRVLAAYLRGLFDAAGWISDSRTGSPAIGLTTCSPGLAEKVLLLLETWGITAKLRVREKRGSAGIISGKSVAARCVQYQIEIRGVENFRRFETAIGFTGKKRKDILTKIIHNAAPNQNVDMVPLDGGRNKTIGRDRLLRISRALPDGEERRTIEMLADADIFWDPVVRVEEIPRGERWVYDLTVEGSHAFLANGVWVHNTAAAEKDELAEGGWTLKAGALVLANGGHAAIDEFDKIDDTERAALHEVMESGTVSVAKAGIVARFSAKTSILAAANPKYGRFDPNMYPAQQFDIPPTLISRFDLIFPMRDVLDEERDRKLADHILLQHTHGREMNGGKTTPAALEEIAPLLDTELLRKYIAYARKHVSPVLTKEANDKLRDYYVELRRLGIQQGAVPITPRYLEGLVRLAEASAKTRLSPNVERVDAERAVRLMDFMLKSTMVDRESGRIDIGVLTGMPQSKSDKLKTVLEIVRKLESELNEVPIARVIEEAAGRGIDETTCRDILHDLLRRTSDLYEPHHGFVKLVRRKED